ncbi:MAG: sel1 repeat family protein, partial [Clostridia bacterium]|nr:sel1 repeat family protein [Clostridia bacterium]
MFYLILFGIILTLGGLGVTGLFAFCRINGSPFLEVWYMLVAGLGGLVLGVILLIVAAVVKRKRNNKPVKKVKEEPKPKEPTFYEKNIEAAQAGDAEAQINIGNCYYSGKGVAKDRAEAVRWYTLAADQGNALAINYLGKCYELGHGVEKNIKQAIVYYKQAAALHEPNALCNLAQC